MILKPRTLLMQSSPQCGAINNLSSTWMGLVISSLLGTSAFLKQLCAPVGIWPFHAHLLSDLGSDSVPRVSKSTSCSEFGAVSPLWHWVAPGECVGPGPSCS